MSSARKTAKTRNISLALQGGGAHGAFTWGVLERLLDQDDLAIDGVSGTSAGAMNAAILASGLLDGRDAARRALHDFWRGISQVGAAAFNPYQTMPFHNVARAWNLDWSPASVWLDTMAQFVSPYQLNPLDRNPLRDLLSESLEPERLRQEDTIRLFVSATNAQTNRLRIFTNRSVSIDALLASACLPQLHRAVLIEGEYYWDGGFLGNPVLKPLIRHCPGSDIMIVQINPVERASLPITSRDIMDRLNEVTMNASLMRELDAISTISRLVAAGTLTDPRYRVIRLHQIADPEVMAELGFSRKNNTAWSFLTYLRDAGRTTAGRWLEANRDRIGKEATLDLEDFWIATED
jgi:NTE family protein